MAPHRMMGIGMPNPCIRMLAYKLHLLQSEWGQSSSTSNMLRQSLEIIQMEVGLGCNIFSLDYHTYGCLASDGWWKQLWCLCHWYDTKLYHLAEISLYPSCNLQQDDRPLMAMVCPSHTYSHSDWTAINWVCKYKGLHSLADITLCDGKTLDCTILTRSPSDSSHVFSIERPTSRDFALFSTFIQHIATNETSLTYPLGSYIGSPHRPDNWLISGNSEEVYEITAHSQFWVYIVTPLAAWPAMVPDTSWRNPLGIMWTPPLGQHSGMYTFGWHHRIVHKPSIRG